MRVSIPASIFAFSLICTQAAATEKVQCPLFLPSGTAGELKPIPGWQLLMPQEVRVTGGGLLHGSPSGEAYLKPNRVQSQKSAGTTIEVSSWELGQPHAFETWLYCEYGAGLQLFRRVAPGARRCSVTGKRSLGGLDELVFVCQ